jgi:hypothetical protein
MPDFAGTNGNRNGNRRAQNPFGQINPRNSEVMLTWRGTCLRALAVGFNDSVRKGEAPDRDIDSSQPEPFVIPDGYGECGPPERTYRTQ